MSKKLWIALSLVFALALLLALGTQAQDQPEPRETPTPIPEGDGSDNGDGDSGERGHGGIRGTVFRDVNNDGTCGTEGEGPLPGVPVRFVSEGGQHELYLGAGDDGTFGLAAAGFGTWEVGAQPSAAQGVVTSASPIYVTIDESDPLALGINFCIGTARNSSVVLPESGAPAVPAFWLVTLAGFFLFILGVGLHRYGRRHP